jgi:hypothetical protein
VVSVHSSSGSKAHEPLDLVTSQPQSSFRLIHLIYWGNPQREQTTFVYSFCCFRSRALGLAARLLHYRRSLIAMIIAHTLFRQTFF